MSVRPPACIKSASTRRIFMKFYIGDFHYNLREKIQICLKQDKNGGHCTRRPKYFYTVDGTTKYFVARQQCKGNPLLRLNVTLNRYILLTKACGSTIQRQRAVAFSQQHCQYFYSAEWPVAQQHAECIAAITWQQRLRKRATMLRYTDTACVVIRSNIVFSLLWIWQWFLAAGRPDVRVNLPVFRLSQQIRWRPCSSGILRQSLDDWCPTFRHSTLEDETTTPLTWCHTPEQ
jgi:hypothetical protein